MMYQGRELDEKLVEQLRKEHRDAQTWLVKNYAEADYTSVSKHKRTIDEIGPLLKRWDDARRKKP